MKDARHSLLNANTPFVMQESLQLRVSLIIDYNNTNFVLMLQTYALGLQAGVHNHVELE